MSVTFNVNLPIVTTGRTFAARKPQVIVGQRPVIAEIEELPAAEALVVAEFPNTPHVRAYAGHFYRRIAERTVVAGQNWLDANQDRVLEALNFYLKRNELLRQHQERFVCLEGPGPFDRPRPLRDIDRETIRDRDDILIGQQISAFEALVPKLRVIGDAIYLQCDEPHLVVRTQRPGNVYSLGVGKEMAETLSKDVRLDIIGIYPLTQFDRARNRILELSIEERNSGQPTPAELASVLQPEAFSSGFPEQNAVVLARRILSSFRDMTNSDTRYTLPRLHNAGASSIEFLAELGEAVDAHLAGGPTGQRISDRICDLLDMDENAPLWSVVDRTRKLSEMMRFVGDCIDDTPVHLEFSRLQSAA